MSCLVLSCQFEQLENDSNSLSINAKDATVISGRFFFTSKETLKKAIEELKLMDTKLLEDKFEKFMNKLVSEAISNISMNLLSGLKAY